MSCLARSLNGIVCVFVCVCVCVRVQRRCSCLFRPSSAGNSRRYLHKSCKNWPTYDTVGMITSQVATRTWNCFKFSLVPRNKRVSAWGHSCIELYSSALLCYYFQFCVTLKRWNVKRVSCVFLSSSFFFFYNTIHIRSECHVSRYSVRKTDS